MPERMAPQSPPDRGPLSAIVVEPKRITAALLVFTGLLMIGSIVSVYLKVEFDYQRYTNMLDLGQESNLPTWFTGTVLFMNGLLLAVIGTSAASRGTPWHRHWLVLALIFVCLSVDEVASIHERASGPSRDLLQTSGMLHYAWVIPAAIVLLALALAYRRFLFALPMRTRLLFFAAATIYVGGAVGFEMLSGNEVSRNGSRTAVLAFTFVEESMEMLGQVLMFYALTDYIRAHLGPIAIGFDKPRA